MATATPVKIKETPNIFMVEWLLTDADPEGDYYAFPSYADKTLHVFGTFDSGSVVIDGSNEDTPSGNGFVVQDSNHSSISLSSNGGAVMLHAPWKVRPRFNGGGASRSVTVRMVGSSH